MAKESRDQKRKKKLAEERRKARENQSLAYLGERYKTSALVPVWMQTEVGIYEVYVITERKLLDRTAALALEKLIMMMRAGTLPPMPDLDRVQYEEGQEENFVIENIRRHWATHFATAARPSKDDLIGVLRTILGSIERMKSPSPQSQTYMRHIAGFLTKKLGVSVRMVSKEGEPVPEPSEGDLVQLGREWSSERDPAARSSARSEFLDLATHLLKSGQATRVIDDCHLLIGEISDASSEVVIELMVLSQKAQQSLLTEMG